RSVAALLALHSFPTRRSSDLFSDLDLIPLRMFVVAEKIGGQLIGGFDANEMVGFALSIPGTRAGHAYLHSHMLAVREQYRNSGRSEEHTSELQSRSDLVCRLL